jgi:hypothetical protein
VLSRIRLEGVALLAISIAGTVAAVRADSAGLAVLFAVTGLLAAAPLVRPRSRRSVVLREDLAAWLDQVSVTTGEPFQEVLDRSVSWYRADTERVSDG